MYVICIGNHMSASAINDLHHEWFTPRVMFENCTKLYQLVQFSNITRGVNH